MIFKAMLNDKVQYVFLPTSVAKDSKNIWLTLLPQATYC